MSDIEEFNELAEEKNISDADEMLKESKKLISDKIKDLEEKHKKIVMVRGEAIEASIKMEMAFNELITKTGGEDLVMNPEKGELHLITGARKEEELLGRNGIKFRTKVIILKKLMMETEKEFVRREYLQSEEWNKKDKFFARQFGKCKKCGRDEQLNSFHLSYKNFKKEDPSDIEVLCWYCALSRKPTSLESLNIPEPSLLADLERIVALRNIFAHVPVNWFSKELEFETGPRYEHFFELDQKWKDVSFAIKEFMSLQKEILDLVMAYTKSVVLKRELFSNIILGKTYNEALEDARKSKTSNESSKSN